MAPQANDYAQQIKRATRLGRTTATVRKPLPNVGIAFRPYIELIQLGESWTSNNIKAIYQPTNYLVQWKLAEYALEDGNHHIQFNRTEQWPLPYKNARRG